MAPPPRATALPTMSQVVALSLTYRLMLEILMVPVAAPLVLMAALRASYFIADGLTNKHTLLSLLLACIFNSVAQRYIHAISPSKVDAHAAVARMSPAVQGGSFLGSCALTRYVVSPLEVRLGIQSILTWSPIFPFSLALRASAFMLILGVSVLLRFVGPPSVMRCSSSPLLEHPFATALRKWLYHFTTDAILDFIAGPSPGVQDQIKTSPFGNNWVARRLQTPMWTSLFSQLFISSTLSATVAFISILPLFSRSRIDGETSFKLSILLACVVATLTQLWQSALNGRQHELDPFRHQSDSVFSSSKLLMRAAASSLLAPSLLVVGAAILVPKYYFDDYYADETTAVGESFSSVGVALATGSLVFLYLQAFDEAVRHLLCTHRKSMKKIVDEIAEDDSLDAFLDVTIHSLLHCNADLVKDVIAASTPTFHSLERDEVHRNEKAVKTMAIALLEHSVAEEHCAQLEEDILRLSILSSFGRGANMEDTKGPVGYFIDSWIQPGNTTAMIRLGGEPPVVPLVRSMCAYVGGLGEACLSVCSSQKGNGPRKTTPWLIPPGASVCATYAVRGASRLVMHHLSASTKRFADWRSTHLSMLIPVLLTSFHRLEVGIVTYVREQCNVADAWQQRILDLIRNECPELLPLYHAITESSRVILEQVITLEGMPRIDFSVNLECMRWIDGIVAKLPRSNSHQPDSPRSVLPLLG